MIRTRPKVQVRRLTALDLAAICGLTASSNWKRHFVVVWVAKRDIWLLSASSSGPVETGLR